MSIRRSAPDRQPVAQLSEDREAREGVPISNWPSLYDESITIVNQSRETNMSQIPTPPGVPVPQMPNPATAQAVPYTPAAAQPVPATSWAPATPVMAEAVEEPQSRETKVTDSQLKSLTAALGLSKQPSSNFTVDSIRVLYEVVRRGRCAWRYTDNHLADRETINQLGEIANNEAWFIREENSVLLICDFSDATIS